MESCKRCFDKSEGEICLPLEFCKNCLDEAVQKARKEGRLELIDSLIEHINIEIRWHESPERLYKARAGRNARAYKVAIEFLERLKEKEARR